MLEQRLESGIELKQQQVLSLQQKKLFADLLGMNNDELFRFLKQYEGKGKSGVYPMFNLEKVMTVPRHLDVFVKDGFIHEASSNYIRYAKKDGGSRSGSRRLFSLLAWMLYTRERLLKAATGFIVRYHRSFFWENKPLLPISMQGAVNYINGTLENFFLDSPIHHSSFTRVIKNKTISVEGKEYPMRFFFTKRRVHPKTIKEWLASTIQKNPKISDRSLSYYFSKQFGIEIARRTMCKYRKEIGIVNSSKR